MESLPAYLRVQADRCQKLSRGCMDLGTARTLRIMADEYTDEAMKIETKAAACSGIEPIQAAGVPPPCLQGTKGNTRL